MKNITIEDKDTKKEKYIYWKPVMRITKLDQLKNEAENEYLSKFVKDYGGGVHERLLDFLLSKIERAYNEGWDDSRYDSNKK